MAKKPISDRGAKSKQRQVVQASPSRRIPTVHAATLGGRNPRGWRIEERERPQAFNQARLAHELQRKCCQESKIHKYSTVQRSAVHAGTMLRARWPALLSVVATLAVGLLVLKPVPAWAGGVVTTATEAALRSAMAGGGTVTFACDGTITLASTLTNSLDTVLDASGHQITLSGGDAVRVFYVPANITLSLNNLTIAQGRSTNNGAGILNAFGTVYASNTVFFGNNALGAAVPSGPGYGPGNSVAGGAVANFGWMDLVNCTFAGNSAVGSAGNGGNWGTVGSPGGTGAGGSIWNSGALTAIGCTLYSNVAAGGKGGDGGPGPPMPFPTPGGAGGAGGDGSGGAIFNSGSAELVNCTLALNTGAGGSGGFGAGGYAPPGYPPPPVAPNGAPGLSIGGIYDASGQCYLGNCTVAFNTGTGLWTTQSNGAAMVNTLLEENSPANGSGALTDLGHNLSSDLSCNFTNAGSLNNTFALLGPLTNNGGQTLTLALLPGSLAIDHGNTAAAPATDQRGVARPFGLAADIGAYEYNAGNNPEPSRVVNECTEAALRAAILAGGPVTFACDGVILLASSINVTANLRLDAAGHNIAITGTGIRLFYVSGNATFGLANLVLTNGSAPQGGAVLNQGTVNATNCAFLGNSAWSSGGALRNEGGRVFLSGCVFARNRADASGGNGGSGSSAFGGAVDNTGTLTADLCYFTANSARGVGGLSGIGELGTPGTSGGAGSGGAVRNSGIMTISRSSFLTNYAFGGAGGSGAPGHHADPPIGSGGNGGSGGSGGAAEGGAIYNSGTARILNSTLAVNWGMGGSAGNGGAGGATYGNGRGGDGANGGSGGNGVGGVFNSGSLALVNSTFANNSGSGGNAGAGGSGGYGTWGGNGGNGGWGGSGFGGLHNLPACGITNVTFAFNSGTGGSAGMAGGAGLGTYTNGTSGSSGGTGAAGGGMGAGGASLLNTLLSNTALGGNCYGQVTDLGHNLSSDSTCNFTAIGSMNNTPALLGPLTNNGGPALTIALMPGSPAIDAGDTMNAPRIDERGFPRPAGAASDIGAYEFASVMPTLTTFTAIGNTLTLAGSGNAGQSCRLLTSADLVHWVSMATNQFGGDGTAVFQDHSVAGGYRFYRLAMP